MRRARSAALLSILVPLTGVVPVVSLPQASPRPVTPEVRSVALSGLDLSPARATVRRSLGPATRALAEAAPRARGAGRPEVFASRRGLDEFSLLGVTWRHGTAPTPSVLVRTHGGWIWADDEPRPTETLSLRQRERSRADYNRRLIGCNDAYGGLLPAPARFP